MMALGKVIYKKATTKLNASTITGAFLVIAMCLPVFGFNRIPLHDMLHSLMHYNFVARDWVTSDSLLSLWNPYREYGMNLFVEHIFNFHPFQYISLISAKFFSDQNTVTTIKVVYVTINAVFALGLYKLIFKLTDCKFGALFAAISAGFYFPWFASPSFNLVTVWLLPLCYYTAILCLETRKVKWIILSLIFLCYSSFQGNGYLGMIIILVYLAVLLGLFYQYKSPNLLQKWRWDSPLIIIVLLCVGTTLVSSLFFLSLEFTEQFFLSGHRDPDSGHNDIRMFLTFATPPTLEHFSGFFHGVGTSRDGIAYAGFLLPALTLYALFFSTSFRKLMSFLVGFSVIFALALGAISFVAQIVFHIPGFSFYRHLGLLLPIAKFHLLIIAAIGLSIFLKDIKIIGTSLVGKRALYLISPLLLVALTSGLLSTFLSEKSVDAYYAHSRYALIAVLVIALLSGYTQFSRRKQASKNIGLLILAVVAIDGASFYSEQAFTYTTEISDESYDFFQSDIEFNYEHTRYLNPQRDWDFAVLIRELEKRPDIWQISATYDSTYVATDTEPCYSTFRRFSTSVYLKSLYQALGAIDGRIYPMAGFEKKVAEISAKANLTSSNANSVPHLLYSTNGNNLVVYNGTVYSVPQTLGTITLDAWRSGDVKKLPGVTTTETIARQPLLLSQSIGCGTPKVKLVDQCQVSVANDKQAVANLLDIIRPSKAPFLLNISEDHGLSIEKMACETKQNNSKIQSIDFSPTKTIIDLEIVDPSQWLYFAYSWNSQTRILVDGIERPVYRTNLGFISTPLTTGDKQVEIVRNKQPLLPRITLIFANIIITIWIFIILFRRPDNSVIPDKANKFVSSNNFNEDNLSSDS
jgi:hypothetical protein